MNDVLQRPGCHLSALKLCTALIIFTIHTCIGIPTGDPIECTHRIVLYDIETRIVCKNSCPIGHIL